MSQTYNYAFHRVIVGSTQIPVDFFIVGFLPPGQNPFETNTIYVLLPSVHFPAKFSVREVHTHTQSCFNNKEVVHGTNQTGLNYCIVRKSCTLRSTCPNPTKQLGVLHEAHE